MKHKIQFNSLKGSAISPWIVATIVVGAIILAGLMFHRDYRREQGHLQEMFKQKGEILIHSLEMLGRSKFGSQQGEKYLQDFWNNLEPSDNVLLMALTDADGQPLLQLGEVRPAATVFQNPLLPPSSSHRRGPITPSSRVEKIDDRWVFLVYRPFCPVPHNKMVMRQWAKSKLMNGQSFNFQSLKLQPGEKCPGRHGGGRHNRGGDVATAEPVRYLWVGFDLTTYEEASHGRVRTTAVFIGLLCLSGLVGVLALIWGHSLRLSKKMYHDVNALAAELIGRLPTGVILKDGEGQVTLVNKATVSISGVGESGFLGHTLEELTQGCFPTDDTMTAREISLNFTGGNTVRVALTSGPVISDDGHHLGQVILMEDLGELGRLKAELIKQEKLATLGGLAAGLAHELRNPLGALRGLSQHLLNKSLPEDTSGRQALEVMLASVDRLNSTITDFLDYARPTEIKANPLNLGDLLSNMATLAGHDARSQAVDLKLDLPAQPVIIDGDETHLSQAFLNLYLNSIEAAGSAGEGGCLVVALKVVAQRVHLIFHDNGPGFSANQLAQPFVPYFTTKAEGTGLGLALVEKTIRAHAGADITLATPPSGGGLVTITFNLLENTNDEPNS